MRESKLAKTIATLIFSLLIGYFITAVLHSLFDNTGLQGNILDFKGTYEFLLATTLQDQVVVGALTTTVFGFTLSALMKKPKAYQDASDFGVHGTARWGRFEEVINNKALSLKNKFKLKDPYKSFKMERGLILGKVPDKNELLIMPRDTEIDNRNVLTVGSSGSGKGQSVVFPILLNNDQETMIVTDPKGELYDSTSQIKRDQGYKVYQIDFINFENGGYNPLDYVFDDQDAQQLAKTIAKNSAKDGKEDFFQVEGQRLLTALIVYCKHEYKDANIPDHIFGLFNKIAKDEMFLDNLLEEIEKDHPAYQLLQSATVAQGKTRSSIMASFTQQTGVFTINKVANMVRKSTFNFNEFQKEKSILYVKLPMDDNPFLSVTATFFDQLINRFYKMADQNHSVLKIPTIFLLDEFANIGKIEKYGRVLATCRGLGMSMITIVQDFAQLEESYGKELTRSILSNHDVSIFLRTKDTETAKYFSNLAGSTTARMKTDSASTTGGIFSNNYSSSKSNQEQYVKRELVTEGELMSIDRNTSYVFISGYYPLKTEKAWQSNIYGDLLNDYSKYRFKLFKHLAKSKKEKKTVIPEVKEEKTIEENSSIKNDMEVIENAEEEEIVVNLETGEIFDQHAEMTNEEETEEFTIDHLDNLVENPQYKLYTRAQIEAQDGLEKNNYMLEHVDVLVEGLNSELDEVESQKQTVSQIDNDRDLLNEEDLLPM